MIYSVYQYVVKHIHRAYFAGNQIQATFLKMTNIHLGHHSSGLLKMVIQVRTWKFQKTIPHPSDPRLRGALGSHYKCLSGVASSHLSVSVCLVDRLTRSTVYCVCLRWTSGKYNPLFVWFFILLGHWTRRSMALEWHLKLNSLSVCLSVCGFSLFSNPMLQIL